MYLRKTLVALSGLFLCVFLVVHLSANALLLLPEEAARGLYNAYSEKLRESLLVKGIAYVLYASIVLHVVSALLITLKNRQARGERGYERARTDANSSWTSQNMGLLGLMVLLFIVVHLANFWARIKLGMGDSVGVDAEGYVDVYEVTKSLFSNVYFVVFYSVLAVPLGLHLRHGLASGFKTLGYYHRPGLRRLATVSSIYAAVMTLGFGLIPLIAYVRFL